MNDVVGSIFYFGSPKDGFKVYPDLGAGSNVFSGYYSNTETDWILIAKKSDEITRYTYVKYGLLTSAVDGRTGSCFGIAIDLTKHYFTDLKLFQTQIVEGVLGAILDDRQVLEIQETSGKVAFKSYDLHDVGSYLDEMSKKIREVIADNKYSNYVRPSFEIPNAGDNPVYGLHPDSSPSALNEYFRTYGVLKLSPKFPVETKSFSEKEEEHKKTLQEEVNKLTEQLKQKDIEFIERLKQKDDEISQSNQRFQKLEGLVKPILNEFSLTALENETPSYSLNQSQQPRYQAYLKPTPKTHSSTTGGHIPRNKWTTQTKVLSVVGIVVALLAILITYWLLSEDENPHVNDANPSSVTNQPKPTLTPREPLLIAVENGKQKGFLNEFAFLEQTDGTIVFNEADFKGVLTSYLFRSSPEIRAIYAGNRDELWRKIMELNPASKKKIADYIKEKVPFKIENSKDQQSLLKDLIIFIESPQ